MDLRQHCTIISCWSFQFTSMPYSYGLASLHHHMNQLLTINVSLCIYISIYYLHIYRYVLLIYPSSMLSPIWSIQPFVNPPPFHWSLYQFLYLSSFTHSFIYSFPSIHSPTHLSSIPPSMQLSCYSDTHPFICLCSHPSIHASISLFTDLFAHSFINFIYSFFFFSLI